MYTLRKTPITPRATASTSDLREGSLFPDGSGRAPVPHVPVKQITKSPAHSTATPTCRHKSPLKRKGRNLMEFFKAERPKPGRMVVPKFLTRSKSRQQLFAEKT
ncbi:unnamed protein product, partial [Mesorhabditis spiculigera]